MLIFIEKLESIFLQKEIIIRDFRVTYLNFPNKAASEFYCSNDAIVGHILAWFPGLAMLHGTSQGARGPARHI